ncbi:LysR family transcriptional regulator [Glaciibacter psychrotolerans]|uniref:DNA-binding transcriptional LysR family regulator n=1 Tax=Glaciibacter psychrotolerans TaxID=670054 RepID=A0A7Z0EI10_9MICO|nr:LysR family transcriptional regulator [Leifsonia psychrotolerans]NYJ21272.1 DNA-binding transcriptional LysR family regulator [Leifsonia psychrotolerans]
MLGSRVPGLSDLQMLVALGDLGSLTQVGQRLGISQQAVSARMRAIEVTVGATLVRRSARGSTLTPTGLIVANWAGDVIAAAERLEAGIESLRSAATLQLPVAASLTIAEYLLPRWLLALRRQQTLAGDTTTQIGQTVTNSEKVIALVRDGSVPLGFIETPEIPADIRSTPVGWDTLHVAVAPGHPWARRRTPLSARELARTPLVTREEGSGTRTALEQLLRSSPDGIDELASPLIELAGTAAVRSAIASGLAPGVLSHLAIADDLALGRLVAVTVTGVTLRRRLSAIWLSGPHPAEQAAQDLIAVARRQT